MTHIDLVSTADVLNQLWAEAETTLRQLGCIVEVRVADSSGFVLLWGKDSRGLYRIAVKPEESSGDISILSAKLVCRIHAVELFPLLLKEAQFRATQTHTELEKSIKALTEYLKG